MKISGVKINEAVYRGRAGGTRHTESCTRQGAVGWVRRARRHEAR